MPTRSDGKPNKKRTMSLQGRINVQYADRQISWDELWMNMAFLVAARARCSRDRVGSVIVDADNRMLSVGYNGPAPGFPAVGWCDTWCPRAIASRDGKELDPAYADCYSIHSESNAIVRATSRPFEPGTTIYTSSSICRQCALLIAAAGITRTVIQILPEHRHRNPDDVVAFLSEAGVEVAIWQPGSGGYRAVFEEAYGIGPHPCYFCDLAMPWPEVVHHVDHDHSNNEPSNLVPAHAGCHTSYHKGESAGLSRDGSFADNPKTSGPWRRKKPMLKCDTCGLISTPGWIKRHCEQMEHASTELAEWSAGTLIAKIRCKWCSKEFPTSLGRGQHESYCSGRRKSKAASKLDVL